MNEIEIYKCHLFVTLMMYYNSSKRKFEKKGKENIMEILRVENLNKSYGKGEVKVEALKNVNGCRAKYGAVQNRLENSIEITSSSSYIYEKSSSDINDADIALEMAEIARTSILMESATAMMAQSNNFPKDMLNILANLRR